MRRNSVRLVVGLCLLLGIIVGAACNQAVQATPTSGPAAVTVAPVAQATNTPVVQITTASATKTASLPIATATKAATTTTAAAETTTTALPQNSRYMDDRSGPVEVLQSLVNAINRKEYLRAYSYWSASAVNSGQVPAYADFEKGYKNTEAVELVTGTISSDAGAGQLYYRVPVTLKAKQTDGTTQTFVGCYNLHLSQPAIQATPPFKPLAIDSANLRQVPNDSDTAELMKQACPPL